jgi:eukaryotic-like serine/threonine-protein kinase
MALDATFGGEETLGGDESIRPNVLTRGDLVGRYVVLDRVGAGAMGVVVAAYDPELDRKVALKLLHSHRAGDASDGSGGHRRLLGEAQALARLSHPNVLAVHDVGEHAGRVFLATELVDGSTLTEWLSARARSHAEILEVFRQAGLGLMAAHEKGLVHRDFKPDNVMVGDDRRVRVMDFGLARAMRESTLDDPTTAELRSSTEVAPCELGMVGTPAYMAPEQHLVGEVDARTDQFAFCVALWEAVFGVRPFRAGSLPELAMVVLEGRITDAPPSRGVPGWLRQVIARGLAREPGDRYPDMAALLAALADDPTPKRRRWWLALGLAGMAAGAWAWSLTSQASTRAKCETRGEEIAAHWNPTVAAAIAESFAATGTDYAAVALEKVSARLQQFSETWAAARVEACLAHEIEGTLGAVARAHRDACLDESRAELHTFTELVQDADPEAVQHAIDSAAGLPPIERCADDARLAQVALLPEDPVLRARIAHVREKLARVRQLDTLGRYADAATVAEDARTLVATLDRPKLQVEIDQWRAVEQARLGEYDAASKDLTDVFFAAGEAGADDVAARVAIELVHTTGQRLARYDEALIWARHAKMLLARVGEAESGDAADLAVQVGHVHRQRDELDEALAQYEEALAQRERLFGADHPRVGAALVAIGTVHEERGRLDDAVAAFQRARVLFSAAYGPNHPNLAAIHNNLGIVAGKAHDHEGAREHHRRSLAIREAALGPDHPLIAVALVNLSGVHANLGEIAEAQALLERALVIREKVLGTEHPGVSFVLNNLGVLARHRGRDDESLAFFRRTLAIREKTLPATHIDIATVLTNMADVHLAQGDHGAALPLAQRALAIAEQAGPEHPAAARARGMLGWALFLAGDATGAVVQLERALEQYERDPVESFEFAALQFHLAIALVATGGDRTRSRALAEAAAEQSRGEGHRGAADLAKITAWIREERL